MTLTGVRLNNGVDIPPAGFGVFPIPNKTERRVLTAIESPTAARSIDTAALYGNETRRRPRHREVRAPA